MTSHEHTLAAFLAGDLSGADAIAFDEHLLRCEECWRAVREDRLARAALELLREPVPTGLADRLRFAVELAPAPGRCPPSRSGRRGLRVGVVAGVLALAGAALVMLPSRAATPSPVAAVVRLAAVMPHPPAGPVTSATEVLGSSATLVTGGQRLQLTYYRVHGVEALVAVSDQPYPMPANAHPLGGGAAMAWTAVRGHLGLYCLNGPRSILLVADLPTWQLPAVAHMLGLG